MIERFYTSTFTVERQTYTADKSVLAPAGSFAGHLQQFSQEEVQNLGPGAVTVTHRAWCALGTNVLIGDLVATGSREYSVKGVQRFEEGANPHLQLLLEQHPEEPVSA